MEIVPRNIDKIGRYDSYMDTNIHTYLYRYMLSIIYLSIYVHMYIYIDVKFWINEYYLLVYAHI